VRWIYYLVKAKWRSQAAAAWYDDWL